MTASPLVLFPLSFLLFCLSAYLGALYRKKRGSLPGHDSEAHFGLVVGATLTLLGLIVGFTFSMALNRYDMRKSYEEAEANAIGTEYLRADLLPAEDAAKVRALLLSYLDQRIRFYTARDAQHLLQIEGYTAKLQEGLWSAVRTPAAAQPTPLTALVVSGMNDVLNSQGYTQAAWWNRIPAAAWLLMAVIAVFANALVGLDSRNTSGRSWILWVLPLVVSFAFLLIADIDDPRRGGIQVVPHNLQSLSQSLHAQGSQQPRQSPSEDRTDGK
jgi:hypothetical protein